MPSTSGSSLKKLPEHDLASFKRNNSLHPLDSSFRRKPAFNGIHLEFESPILEKLKTQKLEKSPTQKTVSKIKIDPSSSVVLSKKKHSTGALADFWESNSSSAKKVVKNHDDHTSKFMIKSFHPDKGKLTGLGGHSPSFQNLSSSQSNSQSNSISCRPGQRKNSSRFVNKFKGLH